MNYQDAQLAGLRGEIAALEDQLQHTIDADAARIASLEAALTSERTEHDAALAELTRSHTVTELEAQAEIDRLESTLAAKTAECEKAMTRLEIIRTAIEDKELSDGACRHVIAMEADLSWPYPPTEEIKKWATEVAEKYDRDRRAALAAKGRG